MNLLEDTIGKTLETIDIEKNFLNRVIIAQEITPKVNKWDHTRLKTFSTAKESVSIEKRQHTGWGNFLVPLPQAED